MNMDEANPFTSFSGLHLSDHEFFNSVEITFLLERVYQKVLREFSQFVGHLVHCCELVIELEIFTCKDVRVVVSSQLTEMPPASDVETQHEADDGDDAENVYYL